MKTSSLDRVYVPTRLRSLQLLKTLRQSNRSRQFSNFGPCELAFRRAISQLSGIPVEQVATAASGTIALGLAVEILDAKEAVIPAFSFVGTYLGVHHAGVKVIFGDIQRDSWRLDPSELRPKSDYRGHRVYVPVVPFGGQPGNGDLMAERCVLDAAASSLWVDNLPQLGPEQAIVFSIHATKPISGGEGSFVIFGSKEFAEEFRSRTQFGLNVTDRSYSGVGINAKLSEFNSAAALSAINRFVKVKVAWERQHDSAEKVFLRFPEIFAHLKMFGKFSPYLIFETHSLERRETVRRVLADVGIETKVWYQFLPGIAKSNEYSSAPVSEKVAYTHLGLPFHLGLRRQAFVRLAESLSRVPGSS